jgi:hypothetical protein
LASQPVALKKSGKYSTGVVLGGTAVAAYVLAIFVIVVSGV